VHAAQSIDEWSDRDAKGSYFEVIDYGNGENGCIDPVPLFNGALTENAPKLRTLYTALIPLLQKLGLSLFGIRRAVANNGMGQ
jgi:hypothetical protein